MAKIDELLSNAKEAVTGNRVYGEPFQTNGVTVIPAATVIGGFGSGEGEGNSETPAGRGGGMGVSARPIGLYKIKGDDVVWVPAVDVNRVVMMGQIMAIMALLVIRSILKGRKS